MRDLVLFFSALADENRLRLLHLMKEGEICVCFLQGVLQANQPKVSRHLAYLKRAGLVETRREGKWIYYRLKKLDDSQAKILSCLFKEIEKAAPIRKDEKRLKEICCSPARFGLSSPKP